MVPEARTVLEEIGDRGALPVVEGLVDAPYGLDRLAARLAEDRVVPDEDVGHRRLVDGSAAERVGEVLPRPLQLVLRVAHGLTQVLERLHDCLLLPRRRAEALEEPTHEAAEAESTEAAVHRPASAISWPVAFPRAAAAVPVRPASAAAVPPVLQRRDHRHGTCSPDQSAPDHEFLRDLVAARDLRVRLSVSG